MHFRAAKLSQQVLDKTDEGEPKTCHKVKPVIRVHK